MIIDYDAILSEIGYDLEIPEEDKSPLAEYADEYCGQIDREIEQLDNDFANHKATLEAIKEGYEYEDNTGYSSSAYIYND